MGSNVQNTPENPTAAGFWVLLDPNQFPGVEAEALYVSSGVILQGDGTSVSTGYLYNEETGQFTQIAGPFLEQDYSVEAGSGIIRTLAAVGDIPVGSIVYLSEDLADPFYAGIALLDASGKVILSGGQIRTANAHTLQSLIEINYVREGNRLMESALSGLDKAVTATDRAISVLADIQNMHNSLLVEAMDPMEFQYWVQWAGSVNTASDYVWKQVVEVIGMERFAKISNTSDLLNAYTIAYNHYASAYFGLPIFPDFQYSSMNAEGFQTDFLKDFKNTRTELSNTISALVLVNGQDSSDSTTLAGKLKKVLDNMPEDSDLTDPAAAYLNLKSWAMDYYRAYEGENYMQDNPNANEATRMIAVKIVATGREDRSASERINPNVTQIIIYVQGGAYTNMTTVPDLSPSSRVTSFEELTNLVEVSQINDMTVGVIGIPGGTLMPTQIPTEVLGGMPGETRLTDIMTAKDDITIGDIADISSVPGTTSRTTTREIQTQVADPTTDIPDGIVSTGEGMEQPIDPFYNSNYLRDASKAGSIQDNITFAITAAQSLNDSQKEQVRRYMYVFEEYYKSASSLLTAITQIIQKIAQGIRPS